MQVGLYHRLIFFAYFYEATYGVNFPRINIPWSDPDFFQTNLEYYTTIPGITAEEVHQVGLDEVELLRRQMTSLAESLGYKNLSFKEFTQKMKNEQSQFFKRSDFVIIFFNWTIAGFFFSIFVF